MGRAPSSNCTTDEAVRSGSDCILLRVEIWKRWSWLIHTRFALKHPLQLASVDSRVVLLQQNTFREFTSVFFMDGGSQLV